MIVFNQDKVNIIRKYYEKTLESVILLRVMG